MAECEWDERRRLTRRGEAWENSGITATDAMLHAGIQTLYARYNDEKFQPDDERIARVYIAMEIVRLREAASQGAPSKQTEP